ncbi:PTS transporter subunit EIIC [Brevibacterium luteolum]|uniref:PTS transporter subunit EIIC n=1 Tax=Brevibacterium luteolum TaxID=199591 RepID=UPI003B66CCA4
MTASPQTIAHQVLAHLGGAGNVASVENCITRLRLPVADQDLVDTAGLKAVDGVLGVVEDQTMQVILGPGLVDEVADAIERTLAAGADSAPATHASGTDSAPATGTSGTDAADAGDTDTADRLQQRGADMKAAQKQRNRTPVKAFLRRVANIFLPLIPALIACGIIAGFNGLLTNLVQNGTWTWAAGLTPILTAIASGFMSLIAVFVGMNAAKEFGGTPIIGGAVAAIIPFAGVADVTIFGTELAPGQGGVIGALLAAVLAAYIERWARTWAPRSLSMLIVPTFTVLVVGVLTLFPLMTVAGWIAEGIGVLANQLLQVGGGIAGFVLAGLFLPLVMFGLHQALIPIHATLIEQAGFTVLLPILAMAGGGQVGAAVAVFLKVKDASMRRTIKSALPAGVLGVGEPLIYGVTLPLGRPFITACVGGAFGGAFIGVFNQLGTTVGSTAIGPSGWALFPLTTGNQGIGPAVAIYGFGLLVSYVAGFLATYFFGFSKQSLAELNRPEAEHPVTDSEQGAAL